MKHYIKNLKNNDKAKECGYALATFIIIITIVLYFINANISNAPTFIYSQF